MKWNQFFRLPCSLLCLALWLGCASAPARVAGAKKTVASSRISLQIIAEPELQKKTAEAILRQRHYQLQLDQPRALYRLQVQKTSQGYLLMLYRSQKLLQTGRAASASEVADMAEAICHDFIADAETETDSRLDQM